MSAVELAQIRVTAVKSDRDPFTIAESVSVIGREQIESEQPTRLGDLLLDLANVDIGGGPRGAGQQIVIRGLGDERILFLLDGARQNFDRAHNARVFIDPDLLKQVEVLRGPASALWGSGALGGVVALTTVDAADLLRPGQTAGARVRAGYQSADRQWLTGGSAYGLVGESLGLLADLSYRHGQDVRLGDGTTLQNSSFETLSGLGKLTWTPAPDHEVAATFQTFDEHGKVPSNPQIRGTLDDLVDRDTRQSNLSLRYAYAASDNPWVDFSALVYTNWTDIEERRVVDRRRDDTELRTTGFDLRNRSVIRGPANLLHDVVAGVDYYQDTAESRRDGQPRPSFPDAKQDVLGLYLQDEISIGKRVILVPGLRWDRYESRSSGDVAEDQNDSNLSKKLALTFMVTDWLSLVAAYNEAFRAPSLGQLFVSGVHFTCGRGCANVFVPNPDLKPETARNKEIGMRLRRAGLFQPGDEGRASLNLFRNDVSDFIEQLVIFAFRPVPGNPGLGGVSYFENVRDARLEGFEAELAYEAPRWFARAGYGLTTGKDMESGEPLGGIPANELILSAGGRLPSHGLSFGWRGRFVAAQDRVPAGVEASSSYDLHDLYLTWQPPQVKHQALRLDFGIDNLMDRDYLPYLSAIEGPGRNIKLTMVVSF
nr:TonB-dependent hemoglobin/transferrin/lactoferrin family receptor [Thiocapsa imhoffii]